MSPTMSAESVPQLRVAPTVPPVESPSRRVKSPSTSTVLRVSGAVGSIVALGFMVIQQGRLINRLRKDGIKNQADNIMLRHDKKTLQNALDFERWRNGGTSEGVVELPPRPGVQLLPHYYDPPAGGETPPFDGTAPSEEAGDLEPLELEEEYHGDEEGIIPFNLFNPLQDLVTEAAQSAEAA